MKMSYTVVNRDLLIMLVGRGAGDAGEGDLP